MKSVLSGNRKSTLLSRYLDEIIDYGGEPFTRAEVISDLKRMGLVPAEIDRWFQGYELARRVHEIRTD